MFTYGNLICFEGEVFVERKLIFPNLYFEHRLKKVVNLKSNFLLNINIANVNKNDRDE